jgi:hypothetical protein
MATVSGFLDRSRILAPPRPAPPRWSRWLVPPAALSVHLTIGQAYAWSVFKPPLEDSLSLSGTQSALPFQLAIVMLGLSAAFGGTLVAATSHSDWTRLALTVWRPTGAAHEPPAAQCLTDREAGPTLTYEITASETHAAVVADPGLIGLFALSGMRHICWIRTNDTVNNAAFDPAGRRLAVVGAAGLYLFAVHDPGEHDEAHAPPGAP